MIVTAAVTLSVILTGTTLRALRTTSTTNYRSVGHAGHLGGRPHAAVCVLADVFQGVAEWEGDSPTTFLKPTFRGRCWTHLDMLEEGWEQVAPLEGIHFFEGGERLPQYLKQLSC